MEQRNINRFKQLCRLFTFATRFQYILTTLAGRRWQRLFDRANVLRCRCSGYHCPLIYSEIGVVPSPTVSMLQLHCQIRHFFPDLLSHHVLTEVVAQDVRRKTARPSGFALLLSVVKDDYDKMLKRGACSRFEIFVL